MEEELATAGTSKSGDPSTERNEEEDGEEYSSGEEGESGTGKDLRPDLERILLWVAGESVYIWWYGIPGIIRFES